MPVDTGRRQIRERGTNVNKIGVSILAAIVAVSVAAISRAEQDEQPGKRGARWGAKGGAGIGLVLGAVTGDAKLAADHRMSMQAKQSVMSASDISRILRATGHSRYGRSMKTGSALMLQARPRD